MNKHIVILGGGTGGTLTANRLRRHYKHDSGVTVTVVDQSGDHLYQPGLLFLPFGLTHAEDITRSRPRQLQRGIEYIEQAIDRVDLERNTVVLASGQGLVYDVLVIATK